MSRCWGVGSNRRGEEATSWGCLVGSIRPVQLWVPYIPGRRWVFSYQETLLSYQQQSSPHESVWFTGIALSAVRVKDKAELPPTPASHFSKSCR